MKRAIAVVLALALSVCLGCTARVGQDAPSPSPSPAAAAPLRIGYVPGNLSNPFTEEFNGYVRERCDAAGIALSVFDADNDLAKQMNTIQLWTQQDYDAIICSPIEPTILQSTIDACMEAGIPFINLDSECERKTTYIGVDQYAYGYAAGKIAADWLNENTTGEISCALLTKPQSLAIIERANGIVAGLSENCPRAKVVVFKPYTDQESARRATLSIMREYPSVRCIVGVADVSILGAYKALGELSLAQSDLCLVGIDATREVLDLIAQDGIIRGSVSQQTKRFAYGSVDAAVAAIEGRPVESVALDIEPVTQKNIAAYLEQQGS